MEPDVASMLLALRAQRRKRCGHSTLFPVRVP
jgi:hypothetical protein